jgi:DNA-binding NarL/FixJ family response regulator
MTLDSLAYSQSQITTYPGALAGLEGTIRVVLAGGSPVLRSGLASELAEAPDLMVTCHTGAPIAQAGDMIADVLILLAPPAQQVTQIVGRISSRERPTRVLVLAERDDDASLVAAIRAGARGYGTLDRLGVDELRDAVRRLVLEGKWLHPAATWRMMDLVAGPTDSFQRLVNAVSQTSATVAQPGNTSLSKRELEVLCRLAEGYERDEIASNLCLTPNTVKTYLGRIRDKLGASARKEILRVAFESGLLADRRRSATPPETLPETPHDTGHAG